MKCPKCGNEVAEGKNFCKNCGNKLIAESLCPKCGKPLKPGAKYCGLCGTKIGTADNTQSNTDLAVSAGYVHWNILPGQLALKIDEQDLLALKDIKGFVVQDGTKALFFVDGALAGELPGGKYAFKDAGIEDQRSGLQRFGSRIASFFTGRAYNMLLQATSIVIVLIRESSFPLIFNAQNIPTAGVRSEVGVQILVKITNIIQFYKSLLMDKKFVSFQSIAASLETIVQTSLEDSLNGVDPTAISANSAMRDKVFNSIKVAIEQIYPFFSADQIIRLTASNAELEEIRRMREELYVSEQELVELTHRNDFLNRLNDEKNKQLLHEAQSAADFAAAMEKIDEQKMLTEDEKAKFADMLFWQRKLREAQNADEGNAALHKLEMNGLLREEELANLKSDIAQRGKLKELSDGQALAMLTLQNNKALDAEKLKWEIEIGNARIENELNRQRMQDAYNDSRFDAELERKRKQNQLDNEEMDEQMRRLREAQEIRQQRETFEQNQAEALKDNQHRREQEALASERAYNLQNQQQSFTHDENMADKYQNMTVEQIMAVNPNLSPAAAQAMVEKYKADAQARAAEAEANAAIAQNGKMEALMQQMMSQKDSDKAEQKEMMMQMMQMMNQNNQQNTTNTNANMQAMMQMMSQMAQTGMNAAAGGNAAATNATIKAAQDQAAIYQSQAQMTRDDANSHQDRMMNMINTQANASYSAAGKIFAPAPASKGGSSEDRSQRPARKEMPPVCPKCGAALEEGSSFCTECGNSI